MNAFPGPYSVLVLDNASIHKGQYFLDICDAKGIRVEYLPPYSPDLNPVCSIINLKIRKFIINIKIFLID